MDEDYYKHTTINPLGLLILIILGIIVIRAKKGQATIPFLILACIIAPAQRIVIAGLFDFNFIRMMILFGWARVFLRNEHLNFKLCTADKLMIAYALSGTILHTVQARNAAGLIFMLGNSFETLGIYFLGRIFVTSLDDVRALIKAGCVLSFIIMCFFILEKGTGRNIFSIFGGVPAFTDMREGRLRVQGAFAHPILAGCFWASLLPGVFSLLHAQEKRTRRLAAFSLFSMFVIIFLTASSTPVIGVFLGFIGIAFFPLRKRMKRVQVLSILGILLISLIKKSPIWHLLGGIDLAGGSSGYYRALLMDQAVRYFKDWYLFGLADNAYWRAGTGAIYLTDITSQYILVGLLGGFLTMLLFIAVIVVGFRSIGRLIASQHLTGNDELLVWALGTTLFTHAIMFMVVAYFGQIVMLWNLQLAIIVSICSRYLPNKALISRTASPAYIDQNESTAVIPTRS
jgi:hypothetical protein